MPFLILKVRYPAISKVIGFSILLGVVIVMNSNASENTIHAQKMFRYDNTYHAIADIQ